MDSQLALARMKRLVMASLAVAIAALGIAGYAVTRAPKLADRIVIGDDQGRIEISAHELAFYDHSGSPRAAIQVSSKLSALSLNGTDREETTVSLSSTARESSLELRVKNARARLFSLEPGPEKKSTSELEISTPFSAIHGSAGTLAAHLEVTSSTEEPHRIEAVGIDATTSVTGGVLRSGHVEAGHDEGESIGLADLHELARSRR